jgi:viroplasmin and RNaseH domain-containing protein
VQPAIPIKKNIPSVSKSEAYYAVGHGLNGAQGVFRSWNEVAPLVMGVSKAVYKRCDNYDEAQEFVEVSRALKSKQMSELPDRVPVSDIWYSVTNSKSGQFLVFPSRTEAQQHVTNVRRASVRKFYMNGEALSYVEGHQTAWQQRLSDESPTGMAQTGETVQEAGSQSFATFQEQFSDESPTRATRTSKARRDARSHTFAKSGSN